jgi:hypothetical protein
MTLRAYRTIIVILFLAVCILAGIVIHYHFFEPQSPVWKSLILSDTTGADTSKPTPHK